MSITNDYTNVYGFYGAGGYGPGKHQSQEFISSKAFTTILDNFNQASKLTGYQFLSPQGHLSHFYGNIIFKDVAGSMCGYLDGSTANYGVDLEKDGNNTINTGTFDSGTNLFSIPLQDDLIFEAYDPCVKFTTLYNSSGLNKFAPQLHSFSYSGGKIVKFYMMHIADGTSMNYSALNALNDYDLKVGLYGMRTVNTEDL